MRKKICIATPVDYGNFGNRLQNYALWVSILFSSS